METIKNRKACKDPSLTNSPIGEKWSETFRASTSR